MKYTTSIVIAAVNTGHSFFLGEHTKREGKDTLESKKSHSVGETLPGAVFLGYVPLNQVWREWFTINITTNTSYLLI